MDLSGLRRYGSLISGTRGGRSPLQRERGAGYAEEEHEEEGYPGYVAALDHHSAHQHEDEDQSTTANFIDLLVEDGYLSPPRSQSDPALEGYVHRDDIGLSLGELMEKIGLARTGYGLVDEAGAPFGRTHHVERQAQRKGCNERTTNRRCSSLRCETRQRTDATKCGCQDAGGRSSQSTSRRYRIASRRSIGRSLRCHPDRHSNQRRSI